MNYFDNKTMTELCLLDSADVKHDRCPVCKNKKLDRLDGFKVCPRCDTMFKILNGQCYVIDSNDMFKEQKTINHYVDSPQGEMISVNNRIIKRMKLADYKSLVSELVVKTSDIVENEFENMKVEFEDVAKIIDELLKKEYIEKLDKENMDADQLGDILATKIKNIVTEHNDDLDLQEDHIEDLASIKKSSIKKQELNKVAEKLLDYIDNDKLLYETANYVYSKNKIEIKSKIKELNEELKTEISLTEQQVEKEYNILFESLFEDYVDEMLEYIGEKLNKTIILDNKNSAEVDNLLYGVFEEYMFEQIPAFDEIMNDLNNSISIRDQEEKKEKQEQNNDYLKSR